MNGLNLHLRAGPASVPRMVVRIHRHGQRIGRPRHWMRRLEHLSGIEGMEIRVVVAQPVRRRLQNLGNRPRVHADLKSRQSPELRLKLLGGAGQQAGNRIVDHGRLSLDQS